MSSMIFASLVNSAEVSAEDQTDEPPADIVSEQGVKSGCFERFVDTRIITLSNSVDARVKMSMCPNVTGSKLPGQTAILLTSETPLVYK